MEQEVKYGAPAEEVSKEAQGGRGDFRPQDITPVDTEVLTPKRDEDKDER